jgi:RNA polymerase-binding transcription factor DksA
MEDWKMTDPTARYAGLREILIKHRLEMQDEIQSRLRSTDPDIQGGIEFALLQMRAETLARIDAALERLDVGKYGLCFDCAAEISESRLRALPFAARCQICEEKREEREALRLAQQRRVLLPNSLSS